MVVVLKNAAPAFGAVVAARRLEDMAEAALTKCPAGAERHARGALRVHREAARDDAGVGRRGYIIRPHHQGGAEEGREEPQQIAKDDRGQTVPHCDLLNDCLFARSPSPWGAASRCRFEQHNFICCRCRHCFERCCLPFAIDGSWNVRAIHDCRDLFIPSLFAGLLSLLQRSLFLSELSADDGWAPRIAARAEASACRGWRRPITICRQAPANECRRARPLPPSAGSPNGSSGRASNVPYGANSVRSRRRCDDEGARREGREAIGETVCVVPQQRPRSDEDDERDKNTICEPRGLHDYLSGVL